MDTNQTKRNLTQAEAADLLGISGTTLAIWRCQRRGPAYIKLGSSVRYRLDDLIDWLNRNRVEHAA
jgi:predicted DNA-binding transcriptional regulator AlpA